jgi:hypothetical protein
MIGQTIGNYLELTKSCECDRSRDNNLFYSNYE